MNLLQQTQIAAEIYLKFAYPKGPPKKVLKQIKEFRELQSDEALLVWPAIEKEETRYCFRMGNQNYPHMKLTFSLEDSHPIFYVDVHDSHFSLPPGVPGYDKLQALRKSNKKLKQDIEAAWAAEKLPIFGQQSREFKDENRNCAGMKVLAVDDEIQILDMLKIIVTSLGGEFLRAESAAQARDLIKDRKNLPHLIFCDIMMPEESGYEFASWLKKEEYGVPIFFITGLTVEKLDEKLDIINLAKVLQKPFSAKSVIEIMKTFADELESS